MTVWNALDQMVNHNDVVDVVLLVSKVRESLVAQKAWAEDHMSKEALTKARLEDLELRLRAIEDRLKGERGPSAT